MALPLTGSTNFQVTPQRLLVVRPSWGVPCWGIEPPTTHLGCRRSSTRASTVKILVAAELISAEEGSPSVPSQYRVYLPLLARYQFLSSHRRSLFGCSLATRAKFIARKVQRTMCWRGSTLTGSPITNRGFTALGTLPSHYGDTSGNRTQDL